MKGSRNHRMWRHNHTGTPHHLPLLHRPAFSTYDVVCYLPLWKDPLLTERPGTPSSSFHLGLCSCDLQLSLCHHPFPTPLLLKYLLLWLLSASYMGLLLYSRLLKVGDTTPGICTPFLRNTLSMEIFTEAQGSEHYPTPRMAQFTSQPQLLPRIQIVNSWSPYLTSFHGSLPQTGNSLNWTFGFKTFPPTVLPISGIASLSTQLLKLKPLSHPWFLFFVSPPTPDSSANLSALLSQI